MTTDTSEDELLTGRQVAALLNITQRTLDRWCANRILSPLYLPNGYRRFRRSDIDRLLRDSA